MIFVLITFAGHHLATLTAHFQLSSRSWGSIVRHKSIIFYLDHYMSQSSITRYASFPQSLSNIYAMAHKNCMKIYPVISLVIYVHRGEMIYEQIKVKSEVCASQKHSFNILKGVSEGRE